MSFRILDIDHLMIRVANLSDAVARYEAMGFTVAPPRTTRDAATTSERPWENRPVLFQPFPGRADVANFLALGCLQDQFGGPWQQRKQMSFLWDTEGPKTVVGFAPDIEATYEAITAAGLEAHLARPPDGDRGWWDEEGEAWLPNRSRPCNPTFRQLPFMVNAYTSDTLESFHYKPWTRHDNTARFMACVTGVTDDILRDAEWMSEQVFGVEAEWRDRDCVVIRVRDIALRIVTPAGFWALYPGLDFSAERILPALAGATIVVADIGTLRDVLADGRVEHVNVADDRVVVPRHAACNTVLEFTTAVLT